MENLKDMGSLVIYHFYGKDGAYVLLENYEALSAQLDSEKIAQHTLAKNLLGEDRYDNSPANAHPFELIELEFNEMRAKLADAESHARDVRELLEGGEISRPASSWTRTWTIPRRSPGGPGRIS